MAIVTAKSSTFFIGTGDSTRVYHSVSDIPGPLRLKLQETTQSPSSATILIADKRGREELIRALQGEPSNVHCRLADTIRTRQSEKAAALEKQTSTRRLARRWMELLLPVAIGASLWYLVDARF
jgi:hypothetical protein